jgi:hypothetical protein
LLLVVEEPVEALRGRTLCQAVAGQADTGVLLVENCLVVLLWRKARLLYRLEL